MTVQCVLGLPMFSHHVYLMRSLCSTLFFYVFLLRVFVLFDSGSSLNSSVFVLCLYLGLSQLHHPCQKSLFLDTSSTQVSLITLSMGQLLFIYQEDTGRRLVKKIAHIDPQTM